MNVKFEKLLAEINPEILNNPDADLIDEGILDSLQIMNIVVEIEHAFQMEFDFEDILPENFRSAQTIWGIIVERGGKVD
jgi:acyl carrier protein